MSRRSVPNSTSRGCGKDRGGGEERVQSEDEGGEVKGWQEA
jgi:hypothetical protein